MDYATSLLVRGFLLGVFTHTHTHTHTHKHTHRISILGHSLRFFERRGTWYFVFSVRSLHDHYMWYFNEPSEDLPYPTNQVRTLNY